MEQLPRKLGLLDATLIVIGIVIGSGIFLLPNVIARSLPSGPAIIAVWVGAGVVSVFGALAFAERGGMIPATGGQFVYLRDALWTALGIFGRMGRHHAGHGAGRNRIPGGRLCHLPGPLHSSGTVDAAGGVAGAGGITVGGQLPRHPGGRLDPAHLHDAEDRGTAAGDRRCGARDSRERTASERTAAHLLHGHWARHDRVPDGIQRVELREFCGGLQVQGPTAATCRKALALAMVAVIALYVSANLAYMNVMTVPEIAATERVGAAAAGRALGPMGATVLSAVVLISIIGAINGSILTGTRIPFAQAQDGTFFSRFGRIHPRFHTPSFSIVAQGLWTEVLILTGSYETLFAYSILSAWIFYTLSVVAVWVLRRKAPDTPRPYK